MPVILRMAAKEETVELQTELNETKDKYETKDSLEPISKQKSKYTPESIKDKTGCWLSLELRLDDFSIKNQAFTITGWINVFWIWNSAPNTLNTFSGDDSVNNSIENKQSQMIIYKNSKGQEIVKILDLRESDISYYLPIDARKIFYQPSLQSIKHIDAPCLYFNKSSKLAHTQFYINVCLLEHLELFMFPFDRQFLNVKLRWNVDYYRILDFEQEKNIPTDEDWWGKSGERSCDRSVELYHDQPLKIALKESIENEVKLYPAWVDFRVTKKKNHSSLRFALIRVRVRRNPMYFIANIIFPLFVIVSCSFSIFSIPAKEIGDRLSVSVTILLTFTAFQSIIAEELPQTSDMLLIDWYIGMAYLLQALLVLTSCITALDIINNEDTVDLLDWIFGFTFGSTWILFSIFYVSMRFATWRNCYDKCCCKLCCCCLGEINYNDWVKRGDEELRHWVQLSKRTESFNKIIRKES